MLFSDRCLIDEFRNIVRVEASNAIRIALRYDLSIGKLGYIYIVIRLQRKPSRDLGIHTRGFVRYETVDSVTIVAIVTLPELNGDRHSVSK
jgi:hypothetical protein